MSFWSRLISRAPAPVTGTTVGALAVGPRRTAVTRGTNEILAAYGSMPWLRAITSRVGYAVGAIEWSMFQGKRGQSRKSVDLVEVESHEFLQLMRVGSSVMSGSMVRRVTQIQTDLVGEGFMVFEVDGMLHPTRMMNLPPSWVKNVPNLLSSDTSKHIYEVQFPGAGNSVPLPADQVAWMKDPSPSDPYGRGSGIAGALARELDIDESAAIHARDFFLNGARADFMFIAPGTSPEEGKAFMEKWNERHQGSGSQWKPAFANRDMKIEKMTQDFSGLGMTELRQLERDIIVQVYGLPPEILGIIQNSNRATIDAADYLFAKYVLVPRLEAMREVLQRSLDVFYPNENMILNYESPVSEDRDYIKSVMSTVPWAFTVDEHRSAASHPPLPDSVGEIFVSPFNLAPSSTPAGAGAIEETPSDESSPKSVADVIHKVTQSDVTRIVKKIDVKQLIKKTKGVIRETVDAFGKGMIRDLGVSISFDLTDPRVVEYLETRSSERITRINDTTKDRIRVTLSEGVDAGETVTELASRVQDVMSTATKSRALTIARTETVNAANFGATEAMRQADIERKEWLATQDDATRDTHSEMDGQKRDIDEDFESSSGASGPYPGELGRPEEDINCRCSTLPVFGDESRSVADSDSKRKTVWKVHERQRAHFDRLMKKAVVSAFNEQERDILRALKESQ